MSPEQERQQRQKTQWQVSRANDHLRRMSHSNVRCGQPAARLIDVRQYHGDQSNAVFFPPRTWLHRCSDDAGCCFDATRTCAPLHTEIVSLFFYVSRIRTAVWQHHPLDNKWRRPLADRASTPSTRTRTRRKKGKGKHRV